MARLRDRPRHIPAGEPARVSPAPAPAARSGREAAEPDPLAGEDPEVVEDADDPEVLDDPEDDFERSERDRELLEDFRPAPVDGALTVLARGRVRSLADLAASRAGTGAVLDGASALVGAAPLGGAAPLVEVGSAPLAGAAPLEGAGATALAGAGSTALAAVGAGVAALVVAALGAGPLPFDRTGADSVTSVRGSGVSFALSIAPMVSVGSVKGKRTSAGGG
jgi:hypothetical protein